MTKKSVILVKYGKARIATKDVMEFLRRKGGKAFSLYLTKDGDVLTIHLEKPNQFLRKIIAKDRGSYIELSGLDDGVYEILLGYEEIILIPSSKKVRKTKIVHKMLLINGSIIKKVRLDENHIVITVKRDGSSRYFTLSRGVYKVNEVYYNDKIVYYIERLEKTQIKNMKLLQFECTENECNIAFVSSPRIRVDEGEQKVVYKDYIFSKEIRMMRVKDVMENVAGYIVRFEESQEPLKKFNIKVTRGYYIVTYDPEIKTMFLVRVPKP